MSRNFDAEYDDYLKRRGSTVSRMAPTKFEPVDEEKERKAKESKSGEYSIPENKYSMQGYQENGSDVGSDALASVRTLRNNLRVLSLDHKAKDQPVKAHLCESACQDLSRAEKSIMALADKRSSAIFRGDTGQANEIGGEMDRIKRNAIRDAYSDLMLDGATMRAFGVDSKWTPEKNPLPVDDWRPMTPLPERKRAATPVREKRNLETPAVRTPSRQSTARQAPPQSAKQRTTPKKNQRLAEITHGAPEVHEIDTPLTSGSTVQDDPYKIPTYVGRCPHCQLTERGLGSSGGMEKHFARYCKVMTNCKFCFKVVMISELTDHLIYRCDFLRGTMEACRVCGLAIDKEDQAANISHPMCRSRKAPSGAEWCPLCTIAVNKGEENWREHCTTGCYNNPRSDLNGERDPYDVKAEQDNIMRKIADSEAADVQRKREEQEAQRQAAAAAAQKTSGGRMIDADQLVSALQKIQERKKAEKKKKMKDAANNQET